MKHILVTGSAGFIGANLVMRLLKDMNEGTIIGLDNQYTLTTDVFDFTLVFEPVSQHTKLFDVIEPGGWEYRRLRSASDLPDGIYQLRSLGSKGYTHRVGFFSIKRKR
jgi:hypothetical protein